MAAVNKHKQVIAIAGGKGGVGKSIIASNIGVILGSLGKKTVLIDMDLGSSNLHTCLGVPPPQSFFNDYMLGDNINLTKAIVPTPHSNVNLISSAGSSGFMDNLKYSQKIGILKSVSALAADYVIIDLGAGTGINTLDFFLTADKGILVSIPEPTSIENTYGFIKSCLFRKLKLIATNMNLQNIIGYCLANRHQLGITTPLDLVSAIEDKHSVLGERLLRAIEEYRPRLIVNQTTNQQEINLGYAIQRACHQFFGIKLDYLGYVCDNTDVRRSVRKRSPVCLNSGSGSTSELMRVVHNLVYDLEFGLS